MMSQIIEIKDFNAPELDVYARMTENQLLNRHEPEKGIFIAESPKVIERALERGLCSPVFSCRTQTPGDPGQRTAGEMSGSSGLYSGI